MVYVRANMEDVGRVSRALAEDTEAGGVQPGRGTEWGGGRN